MASDLQSEKRAANRLSHPRSGIHYWETANRPNLRNNAEATHMTGPSALAEIGGKTAQPAHGVMILIVIY
jgi:hypothetical protein